MMSVNALINQAKAAWDRADEKKADADDWYVRTGRMLVELKGRVEHGQWLPTLEKLGRSERRARELMELAKGSKTVDEQRSRARQGMVKTRANRRNVTPISRGSIESTNGTITPAPEEPDDEYYGGEPTLEERWQNSLANLCADIIVRAPYWDKNMPGWEDFHCPSHIRKLVGEAATALASITATVAKRDRKTG